MKKEDKNFNSGKKHEIVVNKQKFSERIQKIVKDYKDKYGLTQNQIAEKTGVSAAEIIKWKNGNVGNPEKEKIEGFAKALCLPLDYVTGESDLPYLFMETPHKSIIKDKVTGKSKEQIEHYAEYTPNTQSNKKYIDFETILNEIITQKEKMAMQAYASTFSIMDILGYKLISENNNLYLQIPEAKKESILNYDQWANADNGLPITSAECEFLFKQLQSIIDLFEKTIVNYYTSNMAAFNMTEHEHLKEYKTLYEKADGTKELQFNSKEEKEFFEKIFGKLSGNVFPII